VGIFKKEMGFMGYLLPIDPIQSKIYMEKDRLKIKKKEIQPIQSIPRAPKPFSIHPHYKEEVKGFQEQKILNQLKRINNLKMPCEKTKGTVIDTYC